MSDPDFTRPADTHPSAWPFPVELKASDATLRDYFAAKAMHAVLGMPDEFRVPGAGGVAQLAYQMADAMLAARSAK